MKFYKSNYQESVDRLPNWIQKGKGKRKPPKNLKARKRKKRKTSTKSRRINRGRK